MTKTKPATLEWYMAHTNELLRITNEMCVLHTQMSYVPRE